MISNPCYAGKLVNLIMTRLLAILLVPFFVVGNSFAHSHVDAAQTSSVASRAHVHVGGAHEHHHGHSHHRHEDRQHEDRHDNARATCPQATPVDHDADAVYLTTPEYIRSTSPDASAEQTSLSSDPLVGSDCYHSCLFRSFELDRSASSSGPPLYLLHAALRL